MHRLDMPRPSAKFDLLLELRESEGRIVGTLEFATALFDRATVQRQVGYLQRRLQAMTEDDSCALEQIPLKALPVPPVSTPASRPSPSHLPLTETLTDAPAAVTQVQQLFERQARVQPDAVAVSCAGQHFSYGQLNACANQLAHHLLSLGIVPGDRVAVYTDRRLEMVVALLGILKAGAAYVPLDLDYPAQRLSYMLQDSAPAALLSQRHLPPIVSELGPPMLLLELEDGGLPNLAGQPTHTLTLGRGALAALDWAYVIYTSGSTGQPTGVVMAHAALLNLLQWQATQYAQPGNAVTLQFAALGFDVAFQEIFSTLSSGGELVLVPAATYASRP